MKYELAKELKDAGFPQIGMKSGVFLVNDGVFATTSNKFSSYEPTLSELIEACGDDLDSLIHHTETMESFHKWSANCYEKEINIIASTPEEAVAKLWLALKCDNNLNL